MMLYKTEIQPLRPPRHCGSGFIYVGSDETKYDNVVSFPIQYHAQPKTRQQRDRGLSMRRSIGVQREVYMVSITGSDHDGRCCSLGLD